LLGDCSSRQGNETRNAKQAEGVMTAGELKLTPQDLAEIEGAAAAQAAR
jgi:hypothetical protein